MFCKINSLFKANEKIFCFLFILFYLFIYLFNFFFFACMKHFNMLGSLLSPLASLPLKVKFSDGFAI